jgi:hypothetical protein
MSHLQQQQQQQHYLLPPQHHPSMYTMIPIRHHHPNHHYNHTSTSLGHSKVSISREHGHYDRNSTYTTPPNSDNVGGTDKAIVFPHSEDKLTWQQSFENLQLYKRIYGDCNVPQKYKMNVKLGGWVVRICMEIFMLEQNYCHITIAQSHCRCCFFHFKIINIHSKSIKKNKQRKKKKNPVKYGKLTEEQITAMEEIGFKWIVENVQES